jgi:hypothetical protein
LLLRFLGRDPWRKRQVQAHQSRQRHCFQTRLHRDYYPPITLPMPPANTKWPGLWDPWTYVIQPSDYQTRQPGTCLPGRFHTTELTEFGAPAASQMCSLHGIDSV